MKNTVLRRITIIPIIVITIMCIACESNSTNKLSIPTPTPEPTPTPKPTPTPTPIPTKDEIISKQQVRAFKVNVYPKSSRETSAWQKILGIVPYWIVFDVKNKNNSRYSVKNLTVELKTYNHAGDYISSYQIKLVSVIRRNRTFQGWAKVTLEDYSAIKYVDAEIIDLEVIWD